MKTLVVFFVFFNSLLVGCSSEAPKTTNTPEWKNRMQGFALNMYLLFPLISDPVAFQDPKNQEKIDEATSTLGLMAHEMDKVAVDNATSGADVDPSIKVLAGTFKNEITSSLDAFRNGHYEYARTTLYGAMQLCIQCHARKGNDQNQKAVLDFEALKNIKPLYQADFLAAARQFDKSLATYQDVLKDQQLPRTQPAEWERAVERALGIAVRVKGDPGLADKIATLALKSENAPHYFRVRAQSWKDQIRQWRSDSLRLRLQSNDYDRANSLMNYAKSDKSLFNGDARNSYIYYLRASAYLHSYLQKTNDPTESAKAYMLLGECYNVLKDPGEVGLSKNYYKSCIMVAPHTTTASQCFDKYEDEVYENSIGGDASLSLSTVDYLDYLQGLATPK
jgi:hypothetical protein